MKKIISAIAATIMFATPAMAATIWQKVETGMTRAQVEALYPAGGDVSYREKVVHFDHQDVTAKCKADADVAFDEKGIVSGVKLSGNGSLGGRCADEVLTALSSKYGQPSVSSGKEGSLLQRKGTVYVWNRGDGLTMRFKNYGDGAFGGGGLGRKSWELQYSAVAETIGL